MVRSLLRELQGKERIKLCPSRYYSYYYEQSGSMPTHLELNVPIGTIKFEDGFVIRLVSTLNLRIFESIKHKIF